MLKEIKPIFDNDLNKIQQQISLDGSFVFLEDNDSFNQNNNIQNGGKFKFDNKFHFSKYLKYKKIYNNLIKK